MRLWMVATAVCLAITSPAWAGNWVVDQDKSTLTFNGTQSGETFNGAFKRFITEIDFSEATPDTSHIQVTIDMKSATIDGKDRMDSLPTNDWLATDKFPHAEFNSTKIVKTSDHHFTATGNLTIRGITKEVALPFVISNERGITHANGTLILNRHDYTIGQGRWADDQWIAFPVAVKFHIEAMPS